MASRRSRGQPLVARRSITTRIFIDTDDAESYEDIESELEAYDIDFDYDDGGRMMVDDSDADIVMNIIDDLGVKASIV